MILQRPPSRIDNFQDVQVYLISLHRDLERALKALKTPLNDEDYQLGDITINRNVDAISTVSDAKDVLKTLINDLTNYGILNSKGNVL